MLKFLSAATFVLLTGLPAVAADKVDLPAQIATAKTSVEEIAAKVGNYPKALTEIDRARQLLKKAEQAYDDGRQWMGLRGVKPEAEQEVLHDLKLADLATRLATTRAAVGRNEEANVIAEKQLTVLKARVKLLEDLKAEVDRLRQTAQKYDAASKELTNLKADQAKLTSQLDKVTADKKKLEGQVTTLTQEKASLAAQLEASKKSPEPASLPPASTLPPAN